MSNISMVEAKLPPGFRFHPRDDELISHYLLKKVTGNHRHELVDSPLLIEVDLNKCEPWDLSEMACVGGKDWYFYSQRDRKYATGLRTNRATAAGYWKATGKDRAINRQGSLVGMRKTLVFYQGRAPKGTKTDWVMHEFRLQGPFGPPKIPPNKEDWVLCRVFYKSKEGPAQSSMDTTSSPSLPPLTDSCNINFKSNHINGHDYDQQEQVPCFSISPTNHSSHANIFSSHDEHMDHQLPSTTMVEMGGNLARDKKVIEAVLDHYLKIKSDNTNGGGSPASFGGRDGSSGSFLSEVGMLNLC